MVKYEEQKLGLNNNEADVNPQHAERMVTVWESLMMMREMRVMAMKMLVLLVIYYWQ